MKNMKNRISLAFLITIASITNVLAEDPGIGGAGGGETPDPGAPIDNYIIVLAVFAIGLAYFAIKKVNVKKT